MGRQTYYTDEVVDSLADELESWMERKGSLWLKDFCREYAIPSVKFASIMCKTPKGEKIYHKAKDWQESVLVRGGLLKKFDPSFTKYVLSNTIGWAEHHKVEGELGWILKNADGATKDLTKNDE